MKNISLTEVLTATIKLLCAGVLIFFTISSANSGWALLVFVVGSLVDAVGNIAQIAYWPDERRHHGWPSALGCLSSLILVLACLAYITYNINFAFGVALFLIGLVGGLFVQIVGHSTVSVDAIYKLKASRLALYLLGVGVIFLVLLWCPTTYADVVLALGVLNVFYAKVIVTTVGIFISFILIAISEKKIKRREFGRQKRLKTPKPGPTVRLGGDYQPKHQRKE